MLGVVPPRGTFSFRRSDRDAAPFLCLRDKSKEKGSIKICFGTRQLVMGKRRDLAALEDIRQTSLKRLPDNRNELTQIETRSNGLHALDEIIEVYRQHSHL